MDPRVGMSRSVGNKTSVRCCHARTCRTTIGTVDSTEGADPAQLPTGLICNPRNQDSDINIVVLLIDRLHSRLISITDPPVN